MHQIGDPLEILRIGLAPGHVADVPGVADDQFEMPLQDGIAGRRSTPVLSIPTCVTPTALSQSRNASRSRVTVRNVRTSLVGYAPGAPIRRHATTVP